MFACPRLSALVLMCALAPAATAADDLHGDPLPQGALARLGTTRFRHAGFPYTGLAFTPDGQTLVAGEGWAITVWDARTGRRVREIRLPKFYIRGFALSPDGKLAAVSGQTYEKDGKGEFEGIRLVEVATGKVRRALGRSGRYGSTVAFSVDGKYLASDLGGGVVQIDEVETGTELIKERFRIDYAKLVFSGGLLAVAGDRGPVYLWDWQSGKPPREVKMPPRGAKSISFTPDGATLATSDDDENCIRLWDVAANKPLRTLRSTEQDDITRASFSPDGRLLAGTSYQFKGVILWDPVTGKELRRLPLDQRNPGSPAWSADSRKLAVQIGSGVRVWDVKTGKDAVTLPEGHWSTPSLVALLADGTAMTAGDDGTVRLWESSTGKPLRTIKASDEWLRGAAVSPDGRWVVTSTLGKDHAVSLWDVKTGRVVYRQHGHGWMGGRRAVAFSPDGKRFLSWGDDLFLRVWEVRNGKATAEHAILPDGEAPPDPDDSLEQFEGRLALLGAATFSPDGEKLVLACTDGYFLFDAKTGKQQLKIKHEQGRIASAAVSPDGKRLLISAQGPGGLIALPDGRKRGATGEGVILLYDLSSGKLVRGSKHALHSAGRVAFSADGKRFAASCYDKETSRVTFHDTATGDLVGTFDKLPAHAQSLAFSPDGKRVIAGMEDTTGLIYPVPKSDAK